MPKKPEIPLVNPPRTVRQTAAPVERIKQAYQQAASLHASGRLKEAERGYRAILKVAPRLPEPNYQMGRITRVRGDLAGALEWFDRGLEAMPDTAVILAAKAEALGALDRMEEALAIHDRLIRLAPKEVRYRADKALLLQRMGAFEAAETELRRALKRAPGDGALYRMLAVTRKIKRGEPLLADMRKAHADKAVQGASRMQLQFALAKAMEDTGEHGRVFRYLDPANAAMRTAQKFDISQRRQEVDGLIAAFDGADFSPVAAPANGPAPVFVTGLPRSGTTLVEQIIASHSRVQAGGERRYVLAEAYRQMGTPGTGFTPLADIAEADVAGFGAAYLAAMAQALPGAEIVTDKSIQSHLILGLIARAMPSARMIVVRRDPRDLGLSIYRNMFAPGTHLYAYGQEDIAAYVATFEKMLAFWRKTISGRFTEIAYEDLVADPEAQTRALVAAAGLEWEDACLKFHKSDRQVATLSIQQVRQPIHTDARGGWRRYEAELAPMIAAFEREGVDLP